MGLITVPRFLWPKSVAVSPSSSAIDAAGEYVSTAFEVPKTGSITKLWWRITNMSVAQLLRGSLETPDANGYPSGTNYGGSAAGTLDPTGLSNHAIGITLGTPASATKGDVVLAKITFDSTAGNLNVYTNGATGVACQFPYLASYLNSTYLRSQGPTIFAVEYNDGSMPSIGCINYDSIASATFKSDDAVNEYGILFTPAGNLRVKGFWLDAFTKFAATASVYLYAGTNRAPIASRSMPTQHYNEANAQYPYELLFGSPATLSAGGIYRLALRAESTTASGCNLYEMTFAAAAWLEQYEEQVGICETKWNTGTGAWVDTNTKRPLMGLIIDGIDDGAGGATTIHIGTNLVNIGGGREIVGY